MKRWRRTSTGCPCVVLFLLIASHIPIAASQTTEPQSAAPTPAEPAPAAPAAPTTVAPAPAVPAPPSVAAPPSTGNDSSITLALEFDAAPVVAGNSSADVTSNLIALYARKTNTSQHCDPTKSDYASCPTYIIVNLVDWSKPTAPVSSWSLIHPSNHKSTVLLNPTTDSTVRIYGSSSVGLLVVHSHLVPTITGAVYTISSKGKQSVQLADLFALLKLIGVAAGPGPTQALVGARSYSTTSRNYRAISPLLDRSLQRIRPVRMWLKV